MEEIRSIVIPVGMEELDAELGLPPHPRGLVIFAQGSGSSRLDMRNRAVAELLREHGLATLLFDLISPEETLEDDISGSLRFDVEWLARRLVAATDWLVRLPEASDVPVAYFGESTGVSAALIAAVERPQVVRALVSRGGRPDLAAAYLPEVLAPTLFIVGQSDHAAIRLSEEALCTMRAPAELAVVRGAGHLFEERGALEQVAELAARWLGRHLEEAQERPADPVR
jgi:pimeloyl-ACP methyl ester carboxylesterase